MTENATIGRLTVGGDVLRTTPDTALLCVKIVGVGVNELVGGSLYHDIMDVVLFACLLFLTVGCWYRFFIKFL